MEALLKVAGEMGTYGGWFVAAAFAFDRLLRFFSGDRESLRKHTDIELAALRARIAALEELNAGLYRQRNQNLRSMIHFLPPNTVPEWAKGMLEQIEKDTE